MPDNPNQHPRQIPTAGAKGTDTMGLADRLAEADPNPPAKPKCKTGLWLREQSVADQLAFAKWIEAGHDQLFLLNECKKDGLEVSQSSFYRHARGECHCTTNGVVLTVEDLEAAVDELERMNAQMKKTTRTRKARS